MFNSFEMPQLERLEPEPESENDKKIEQIKEKYLPIIGLREKIYDQDIEEKPELRNTRASLDVHNNIVLGYAAKLIKEYNLPSEQEVAAMLATILHDCGKLNSEILEHHEKGAEYAGQMLDEMIREGRQIEGVPITEEIKSKVLEAIERHMNHPYLVAEKGGRFPEPQDDIDKIVFDVDMMANVGFKNVGFHLTAEKLLRIDIALASKNNTSVLRETFERVMQSVATLDKAVLSEPAKKEIVYLIDEAGKIFDYLKKNQILDKIQNDFSVAGEFNKETIEKKGGVAEIKKILNEEIIKAGRELHLEPETVKNFQM